MTEQWRFIHDKDLTGDLNMAADQVLLNHCQADSPITLRFYSWKRPTLSLGRNQKLEQINVEWCKAHGIDLVKRSTGGQAVLHGEDLTYSIIGSVKTNHFSGGILQIYKAISAAFQKFFENIGLAPELHFNSRQQRLDKASPVCFVFPSSYEITIQGKKLIGSAQRQTTKSFLQHGTIPLSDQAPLLSKIFKHVTEVQLRQSITDLNTEGVMKRYNLDDLGKILRGAFESIFKIQLIPSKWEPTEWEAIQAESANFPFL